MSSGPNIEEVRMTERADYYAVGKANSVDSVDSFRAYASFVRKGALYEFTALLACVGARVLLEKKIETEKVGGDLSGEGGFMTPSYLGMKYVERLREAGAKIEVKLLDD